MSRVQNQKKLAGLITGAIIIAIVGTAVTISFLTADKPYVQRITHETEQKHLAENSIEKAEDYLLDNFEKIDLESRIYLDYLQRKFDLNERFNAEISQISLDSAVTNSELHDLLRVAYPEVLPQALAGRLNIISEATHCDHIPLPNDFAQRLEESTQGSGERINAAAISLHLLNVNKCTLPENADELADQIVKAASAVIRNRDTPQQLRYQSIAYLMVINKKSYVQQAWIDQITDGQLLEGGWADIKGDTEAGSRTTLYALWTLLEYVGTDTESESIIQH